MKLVYFFIFFIVLISFQLAGAKDCFSHSQQEKDSTPVRYLSIPKDLLNVLRASYSEHSPKNKYLDNAFWGANPVDKCQWPQTFWEALDNISPETFYTIASIYQRTNQSGCWGLIKNIKNIWLGTSYGFNFNSSFSTQKQFEQFFKNNSSFCRDLEVISNSYHQGQICWREIPSSGNRGLHFCFGAGESPSVHIDYNQPVIGKLPLSDTCAYDPLKIVQHYKDLKSDPPNTVFDILDKEKAELRMLVNQSHSDCKGYMGHLYRQMLEGILVNLKRERIVKIAMEGEYAVAVANRLIIKINVDKENLQSINMCSCQ